MKSYLEIELIGENTMTKFKVAKDVAGRVDYPPNAYMSALWG